jgi:hypothetical protein
VAAAAAATAWLAEEARCLESAGARGGAGLAAGRRSTQEWEGEKKKEKRKEKKRKERGEVEDKNNNLWRSLL